MSFWKRLFGKKTDAGKSEGFEREQSVMVYLDGRNLPDSVYKECDTGTLSDLLTEVLTRKGLGEFDGTETGPTETALIMYGPNAELLFSGIEGVLREYPLCQGARVVISRGGRDGEKREIRL